MTSLVPPGAVPPQYEKMIPRDGFSPTVSALWQLACAWILGLPGDGSPAFAWTMYALYIVFLLIYLYYFAKDRILKGV